MHMQIASSLCSMLHNVKYSALKLKFEVLDTIMLIAEHAHDIDRIAPDQDVASASLSS